MADFNFEPERVELSAPKYNNAKTKMEGMRIKARLKSEEYDQSYTLYFRVKNDTEKDAILNHFKGQYADTIPFTWTSVPAHIGSSSIYVRYNSLKMEPTLFGIWEIEVGFDREVY